MIDHAHDLAAVFFGPDFASLFNVERAGVSVGEVRFILGETDEEALENRAVATTRTARFAGGQDVRADDRLVAMEATGAEVPVGTVFKVLDRPKRVNDGLEMEALLGSATA